MKIVGWTWYGDPQYKEMFEVGGTYPMSQYEAALKIIADELKAKGYKFSGEYHQNGDYGAPIFDTGEIFQCSKRVWGGIIADAYSDEIDNRDGFGYTMWAWEPPEKEIVPNPGDYRM